MVQVERWRVAAGALALAEEELLAPDFLGSVAFAGSSLPVTRFSFGAGGKSNMFCICAMWLT